jgi:hypothetical protein
MNELDNIRTPMIDATIPLVSTMIDLDGHPSDDFMCRICRETQITSDGLISPCSCLGTSQYIHPACWALCGERCQACRHNMQDQQLPVRGITIFSKMFQNVL